MVNIHILSDGFMLVQHPAVKEENAVKCECVKFSLFQSHGVHSLQHNNDDSSTFTSPPRELLVSSLSSVQVGVFVAALLSGRSAISEIN